MAVIEFSARARADLRGIFFHSVREFGLDRANDYIAEIDAKLALLAEHPRLAPLKAGYSRPTRATGTGSHVIYYESRRAGLFVVRVLHMKMEAALHVARR